MAGLTPCTSQGNANQATSLWDPPTIDAEQVVARLLIARLPQPFQRQQVRAAPAATLLRQRGGLQSRRRGLCSVVRTVGKTVEA